MELTEEEKQETKLRQVEDSLAWDKPERRREVSIQDREAANLVKVTEEANGSWSAAKAREVAGLHEALGLDWKIGSTRGPGRDAISAYP